MGKEKEESVEKSRPRQQGPDMSEFCLPTFNRLTHWGKDREGRSEWERLLPADKSSKHYGGN